eukprot:m.110168 g.110168  ORF g.110168 m.110168 type:complete len:86 (+) comp15263_c0_seq2:122-379(+)
MNMDHILWLQIKLIRRSFGFPVSCFLKNLGDVAYSFEGSSMHNNTAAFLHYAVKADVHQQQSRGDQRTDSKKKKKLVIERYAIDT